jgi:hypothetical protein
VLLPGKQPAQLGADSEALRLQCVGANNREFADGNVDTCRIA